MAARLKLVLDISLKKGWETWMEDQKGRTEEKGKLKQIRFLPFRR